MAHGPRRRYNDDGSTATDDLAMITGAPGPPTIQPGIPALQPSIPTAGVASLDIPPAQQPSSWRSLHSAATPAKDSQPSDPGLSSPLTSTSLYAESIPYSVSHPGSTITSIPYLSDLMSQLFSQSTTTPESSIYTPNFVPSSAAPDPKLPGTPSKPTVTSRLDTTTPFESDPETTSLPASTPAMLIYSLTLPPYSNGLDTSGIVESLTRSSPAEGMDKLSVTVYSYNLPPYTPKIPTYVATSASTAPLDMTTGAPGGSGGAAPTDRIFLPKGFVDPIKDPVTVTSSTVPLYSPACLGNAYGGGYVITPTLSVANINATGIGNVPPAYGYSYKFEPTVSPGYGAAAVIVNTKAQPNPSPSSNRVFFSSRPSNSVGSDPGPSSPPKDASWGSNPGTSTQDISTSSLLYGSDPPYGSSAGIPPFDEVSAPTPATGILSQTPFGNEGFIPLPLSSTSSGAYDDSLAPSRNTGVIAPGYNVPTTVSDPQNTRFASSPIFSSGKGSGQSSGHPSVLANHVTSVVVTTSTTWCPSTAPDHLSIISSILGHAPLSTAITAGGDLANGGQSDKGVYPVNASKSPWTALAAVTTATSTSTESESFLATVLPQEKLHQAAVAFDSTVTDAYGTVSVQHLSSKINSTFILSGDEPGVTPFEGRSARLTASMVLVFAVVLFVVCLLSSYV
ncbi:MAG: hypothetical protein Q9168_001300 [Polycauliona sp. 1 TL-2023]